MYENIPDSLKAEKSWVNVWKNSKVPMQSTIRKAASSVNPETWSDFQSAEESVRKGQYDGIGYVFHDTGLIGIDIDAGFTEDGFLSPLAVDIMNHCKSYTEKSRSGRGIHILLKGTLPFKGKNNREAVEIYKSCRYFIMTGKTLVFSEIVENQEAIDYVLSQYFSDEVNEVSEKGAVSARIYSPVFSVPNEGRIRLKPEYPPIGCGGRNLSLTSVAGQMHNQGYTKAQIYAELLFVNESACTPPLPQTEVQLIVNSVTKYRR